MTTCGTCNLQKSPRMISSFRRLLSYDLKLKVRKILFYFAWTSTTEVFEYNFTLTTENGAVFPWAASDFLPPARQLIMPNVGIPKLQPQPGEASRPFSPSGPLSSC